MLFQVLQRTGRIDINPLHLQRFLMAGSGFLLAAATIAARLATYIALSAIFVLPYYLGFENRFSYPTVPAFHAFLPGPTQTISTYNLYVQQGACHLPRLANVKSLVL
jgi:hypothetical protein